MNAPKRWRDDASVSDEVRLLVSSGGRSRPLPSEVRERTARHLGRMMLVPAAAGLAFWIKGVALAAAAGLAGYVVVSHALPSLHTDSPRDSTAIATSSAPPPAARTPSSAVVPPASASATEAPAPPPPAVQVPAGKPSTQRAPSAPVLEAPPSPPSPAPSSPPPAVTAEREDPLLREAALLEQARAKLDSDPAAALAVLDSPELRDGRLALERELVAVDALRRLHRFGEARSRGEALVARARGTIYEERARKLVDGIP